MACKYKVRCVETGIVYNSLKEAAKSIGKDSTSGISECCRKPHRKSGGYHWEYVLDNELPNEVWKPAKLLLYETSRFVRLSNYEASNLGRIRNIHNKQIIKGSFKGDYMRVVGASVHRIIASTFIINNDPKNKTEVNHIDENKINNCVDNLEWVSRIENVNHGTGIKRRSEKCCKRVRCITTGECFASLKEAMEKYNIKGGSAISKRIKDGKSFAGKLPNGTLLDWEYINDDN